MNHPKLIYTLSETNRLEIQSQRFVFNKVLDLAYYRAKCTLSIKDQEVTLCLDDAARLAANLRGAENCIEIERNSTKVLWPKEMAYLKYATKYEI